MPTYQKALLISLLILTPLGALYVRGFHVHEDDVRATILASWLVGLWVALLTSGRMPVVSRVLAIVVLLPSLGLFLFQLGRRVEFIWMYGGMDCADCNGSPMAFLMGMVFELILTALMAAPFLAAGRELISRKGI